MADRSGRPFALTLLLFLVIATVAVPVSAQTITVQNGGTFRVENGGVWDLLGSRMDFGGVGAAARLTESTGGRIAGGRLTATRALSSPSSANVAGLGAQISASVDLGEVTVVRGHVRHTLPDSNASINRFYDLFPSTNNRGLSATLTYHYADAELDILAESTVELFKSDDGGSSWRPRGADSRDTIANTVTLRRIRSFSRWTLGPSTRAGTGPPIDPPGGPPATMPPSLQVGRLKLASLQAGLTGDRAVYLTWRSAPEAQHARFAVQRKRPGAASWTTVGFVEGGDTTGEPRAYAFTDSDLPYADDRLTYRLRQVDPSGAVRYSNEVEITRAVPDELALHGNVPNPVRSQTTIRYELPAATHVRLAVYNAIGQRIVTLVDRKQEAGRKEVT